MGADGPPAGDRMKLGGQSQNHLKTHEPSPTPGPPLWNFRTMSETENIARVAAEIRNYNLTVLGIREIKWTGSGQLRLATADLLLY